MSFGRKADPKSGRCRRTGRKKWRCSKEACPDSDSKYYERHMHRGRNRSRKSVEVITANTSTIISSIPINPSAITNNSSANSSSYSLHSLHQLLLKPITNTIPNHLFLYPHSSSSRPPSNGFSLQNNSCTHLFLDSGSYSQANKDYRYFHGLKGEVDERSFSSETSGTARSAPDPSLNNSWRFTPLAQSKQRSCAALQGNYSQPQLQSLTFQNSKNSSKSSTTLFWVPISNPKGRRRWREKRNPNNLFATSSTSDHQRAETRGSIWRTTDQTRPHSPQPSSRSPLLCHLSTSQSLIPEPRMVI